MSPTELLQWKLDKAIDIAKGRNAEIGLLKEEIQRQETENKSLANRLVNAIKAIDSCQRDKHFLEQALRERDAEISALESAIVTAHTLIDRANRERDEERQWSVENKSRLDGWIDRCKAAEAKLKQYEQDKPTGKQPREIWLAIQKSNGVVRYYDISRDALMEELLVSTSPDLYDVIHFREVV